MAAIHRGRCAAPRSFPVMLGNLQKEFEDTLFLAYYAKKRHPNNLPNNLEPQKLICADAELTNSSAKNCATRLLSR